MPQTVTVPYNDLSNSTTANPLLSFVQALNQVIAPMACQAYRDNPNVGFQFIPGGSSTPFGQIQRGYMESLCAQQGGITPTQPPSSGFTGGQCPLQYTVNYSVDYTMSGVNKQTYSTYTYIWGKVQGIKVYGVGDDTQVDITGGLEGNPNASNAYHVVKFTNSTGNKYRYFNARITSITPRSGGADTCGNYQPPTYPPVTNPINLPPITIPVGGNDVTITGGNITFNVDASTPIKVTLAPDFNLNFGYTGVTVNFPTAPGGGSPAVDFTPVLNAIGGVQGTLNNTTNPKIDNVQNTANGIKADTTEILDNLEAILNEIRNVVEVAIGAIKQDTEGILHDIEFDVYTSLALLQQATITDIPATLTQIRADIAALDFDCVLTPDTPDTGELYEYTRQMMSTGHQTGEFGIFPSDQHGEPYAVELVIDTIPKNAKIEKGAVRKDVYYAGWSTWGVYIDNLVHREPIHFLHNVRLAPEKARGFVWALREGYTCTCTLVFRKKITTP